MHKVLISSFVVAVGRVGVGFVLTQQPETRSSFTITYQETVLAMTSGHVEQRNCIYAERGDGSTVRANLNRSGIIVGRRIESVSQEAMIADEIQAVSTTFYSPEQVAAHRNKLFDPTCETYPRSSTSYNISGLGEFFGVSVVKHIAELDDFTIETWESPECNCAPLLQRVLWRNEDKTLEGTTEVITTALTFGEPDASLFDLPRSYTEMPPSELMRSWRSGHGPSDDILPKVMMSDKRYYESQRYRPKN